MLLKLFHSLHQGTNFGMKSHSAPMQPTMNMDTAAQTLNLQSDIKVCDLEERIFNDFHKSNKTWSNSPTAPFTTTLAEGLIQGEYSRRNLYKAARTGLSSFDVFFGIFSSAKS